MATAKEIEVKSQEVEVLSREADGTQDLITSVTGITTFEVVCLVNGDRIDTLIEELEAAKELINGDPLHEAALIVNIENEVTLISKGQVDAVGNHLKNVFLPAALTAKESERDAAIDELVALKDE